MLQKLSCSRGFTAVGVLIAITVAVIVTFGGWFMWHRSQQKNDAKASSTSQNQPKLTVQANIDPSKGGRYFFIKEWNMRFPLSETLRGDVEYGVFSHATGEQSAYFASKKIAKKSLVKSCGLFMTDDSSGRGMEGGQIVISRLATKPTDENLNGGSFQLDNYWYTINFSNGGACFEGDTGKEMGAFKSAMGSALQRLEAVK